MHATDIVGYMFQVDIWHGPCLPLLAMGVENSVEDALDAIAVDRGVDREDERSFDSDEFPKVIFASQVECTEERCGGCGESLLDH